MDDQWSLSDRATPPASLFPPVMRSWFKSTAAPYASADAFRQLYECTHMAVYRFVYALHGGPAEDVEDVAAETFERAWNGRTRFRGDEDDAVGWLLTIARNLVIDRQRKEQRRPAALPIEHVEREPQADIAPERDVLGNEQQRTVLAALQPCPSRSAK